MARAHHFFNYRRTGNKKLFLCGLMRLVFLLKTHIACLILHNQMFYAITNTWYSNTFWLTLPSLPILTIFHHVNFVVVLSTRLAGAIKAKSSPFSATPASMPGEQRTLLPKKRSYVTFAAFSVVSFENDLGILTPNFSAVLPFSTDESKMMYPFQFSFM